MRKRRVESGLLLRLAVGTEAEAESKEGSRVRGSDWCRWDGQAGFLDKASQVEHEGKGIAEQGGFGGVGEAEPGGTFQGSASLRGIAGLGIGLSADAQFPGSRADLRVACETDAAIRESQADGEGKAERVGRIGEGAGSPWSLGFLGKLDVGLGLVEALLVTNPFGGMVRVVVAVAGTAVTEWAERDAILVVAALQAGERQVITFGMADTDGTQGMQILVNVGEYGLMSLPGVAKHFANAEIGEAAEEILETGDSEQVVIVIGRGEGAGDGPERGEAIIQDVEGFGLVAEVVLAMRGDGLFRVFSGIRVRTGLVGAGVIDIGGLGIAEGGKAAMFPAGGCVTGTALFASCPGRTGTCGGRLGTGGDLMGAAHVGAGSHQLAVGGDADAPLRGIFRESRVGGDQSIGQEGLQETVFTTAQPIFRGILAGHAESGGAGQVIVLETQCPAISTAAFGLAQFARQSGPIPCAVASQEQAQAQAEWIKAGRAEVALEAGTEIGSPGREIEEQ